MTISTALKMAMGSMALCVFAAATAQANYIPNTVVSGNNDLEADVVVTPAYGGEPDGPLFTDDFEIVSNDATGDTTASGTPVAFAAITTSLSTSPAPATLRDAPEPGTWMLVMVGAAAIGIGWRKRKA